MKKKGFVLPDRLAVYGLLLLLLALGLAACLLPRAFSDSERRFLAQAPSHVSLLSWTLNDDTEDFLSDQIPLRRALVSLSAGIQCAVGRAVQLDAWPVGDAIVEKPVQTDAAALLRRVEALRGLSGDIPCLFLTPPTAGMLRMQQMSAARKNVYAQESALYDALAQQPDFIAPRSAFEASEEAVYYRTDHHWTLHGAYLAYQAYCHAAGLETADLSAFSFTEYAPFYGTTLSRSGLPFAQADTLRCAEPKESLTLRFQEDEAGYDHLIFPEQAQTYDGYAVYLNGNHGLLEITTPGAPDKTLFICKDSFANSLIPFLTPHYRRIIAVDARYLPGTLNEALSSVGPVDQVLFLYSLDSLATDTAITRKLQR